MNMVSLKRKIAVESGLFFLTISLISNENFKICFFFIKLLNWFSKVCLTITWLPYAIFSFYKLIYHNTGIDPFWGAIPAMFAKSSLLWNAILFMIMNKRLKKNCLALFRINISNRRNFYFLFFYKYNWINLHFIFRSIPVKEYWKLEA